MKETTTTMREVVASYEVLDALLAKKGKLTVPGSIFFEEGDIIILKIKATGRYSLPAGAICYYPNRVIKTLSDALLFMAMASQGPDEHTSHR